MRARRALTSLPCDNDGTSFDAFRSRHDPRPGGAVAAGRVTVFDGLAEADFDRSDLHIARRYLGPEVAAETMATPSDRLARLLADIVVSRAGLVRRARWLTPAKLADVVARPSALEIAFADMKMRARRMPGNRGHLTNAWKEPPTPRTTRCSWPRMRRSPWCRAPARSG